MHRVGGRRARTRLLGLAAVVAVGAMSVAACGDDDDDEAATAPEAAEEESADTTAGEDAADTTEAEEPAEESDEEIELRFTWWGSDARHETTQQVIDMYEAENPNVTITGEFTGWGEYWDRLATTVAAGDAPDIMQQESRYVREYAERGQLLDLSQYEQFDDSQLDPAVLPTGQIDGAQYAVPTGVNAYAVVADPAAFEAAGVEMPDDTTWTWQDYIDTATAITEGSGGAVYGTQDRSFNETDLEIYARQHGEALYSDDGFGFDPALMEEWWNITTTLVETGGEPEPSRSVEIESGGPDQSLLATNEGAMAMFWTNQLGALAGAAGRDLELLRFPGESEFSQPGMYLKPAMFFSVSAESEHPEEAVEFLNYLVNAEAVADVFLTDRGMPVNLDLRAHIVEGLEPVDQQVADFIAEISPDLAEPPGVPPLGAGDINDLINRLSESVLFGQVSVADAVDQFMSEGESILGG